MERPWSTGVLLLLAHTRYPAEANHQLSACGSGDGHNLTTIGPIWGLLAFANYGHRSWVLGNPSKKRYHHPICVSTASSELPSDAILSQSPTVAPPLPLAKNQADERCDPSD